LYTTSLPKILRYWAYGSSHLYVVEPTLFQEMGDFQPHSCYTYILLLYNGAAHYTYIHNLNKIIFITQPTIFSRRKLQTPSYNFCTDKISNSLNSQNYYSLGKLKTPQLQFLRKKIQTLSWNRTTPTHSTLKKLKMLRQRKLKLTLQICNNFTITYPPFIQSLMCLHFVINLIFKG
jgi:hypothetical protein